MKMILVSIIAGVATMLSACNQSVSASSQDISYDLTQNQCPTGKHSFSNNGDLCAALQDNSLNHNCALDLRQQRFETDCPGATFSPH